MSIQSESTGVELRRMEINVFRINSIVIGLGIAFVLIQSLLTSPIIALNFLQYVALGVATFLLRQHINILRRHNTSKSINMFQMKFLHYTSHIGLTLTIMASLSFSSFHPIVGIVNILLLVPYLCFNIYISRSIRSRYHLMQNSSERSC